MRKFLKESWQMYLSYMRGGLCTLPVATLHAYLHVVRRWNEKHLLWFTLPVGFLFMHYGYTWKFPAWVPDWLWNAHTSLIAWYRDKFTKYGSGGCLSYGKRIYLIDDWPGYDWCLDPRCTHYRCEHGLGV